MRERARATEGWELSSTSARLGSSPSDDALERSMIQASEDDGGLKACGANASKMGERFGSCSLGRRPFSTMKRLSRAARASIHATGDGAAEDGRARPAG